YPSVKLASFLVRKDKHEPIELNLEKEKKKFEQCDKDKNKAPNPGQRPADKDHPKHMGENGKKIGKDKNKAFTYYLLM
ncbi:23712_t:CDS:2, partial [Gigaspora margarita]